MMATMHFFPALDNFVISSTSLYLVVEPSENLTLYSREPLISDSSVCRFLRLGGSSKKATCNDRVLEVSFSIYLSVAGATAAPAPIDVTATADRCPHLRQNCESSSVSAPHFGQNMTLLLPQRES